MAVVTIHDGRFMRSDGDPGVRVIDALHHLGDSGSVAATAEHYELSEDDVKAALNVAIAAIAYKD